MKLKKKESITERLSFLYGKEKSPEIYEKIEKLVLKYKKKVDASPFKEFSEEDVVLITYGGQVVKEGEKPLSTLNRFLEKYCGELLNTIHILPFFPYSSDDGFSVIDYKKVDPNLGSWKHISESRKSFKLMFDAVINHISVKSEWFSGFLRGTEAYKDFFITPDDSFDFSSVFRPRNLPLLTEFDTSSGKKKLWTTFSPDQIDLNYSSPELLLAVIEVLLFYVSKGASLIRLDAVGFLWKKSGTSCVHLPETHETIRLTGDILDCVAPATALVTETNVPYRENISYFGNFGDEARMVYNFSLPPLAAHAVLTRNSNCIRQWATNLVTPENGCAYFNFTASHDGIGLVPAKGLIPEEGVRMLCRQAEKNGGRVSTKSNPDGTESPYELNINYMELLREPGDSEEALIDKFILTQAVMLAMPGVPGIYFHSLFGSGNYEEGVRQTGRARSINREKLSYDKLLCELERKDSRRHKVFSEYSALLSVRKGLEYFNPGNKYEFPRISREIFAIKRYSENGDSFLLALNNLSAENIQLNAQKPGKNWTVRDVITGKTSNSEEITLRPFGVLWLL